MKPISANVADIAGNQFPPSHNMRSVGTGHGSVFQNVSADQSVSVGSAALPDGGADYNHQQIEEAVNKMNKEIQRVSREIQFSVDKSTDRVVIKVIDQQTKQVIRQIPSEEVLNLAEHLGKLEGMLVNEKA